MAWVLQNTLPSFEYTGLRQNVIRKSKKHGKDKKYELSEYIYFIRKE